MAFFIETITVRTDGAEVTERVRVRSEFSAHQGAEYKAQKFYRPKSTDKVRCWCVDCAPVLSNDFGEDTIVYVNEYSDDARVKEGLEISQP